MQALVSDKVIRIAKWVFLITAPMICLVLYLLYLASLSRDKHQKLALEEAYEMRLEDIPTNNSLFGILIVGSDTFRLQIARSLLLLNRSDAATFERVTNSIGIVREDARTVANYTNKPPLVMMSQKTASYSLTWCASGLAHEACHLEQEKRRSRATLIPTIYGAYRSPIRGYMDFQRDEQECIALELQVLKRLGAPRAEVEYVRSQDGTHFDVNRDGKWDSNDYKMQHW